MNKIFAHTSQDTIANKHLKNCSSISYQENTIKGHNEIAVLLVKMAKLLDNTLCWQAIEHLHIANESVKYYNHFGNTTWPCNIISEYLPKKYKYAHKNKKHTRTIIEVIHNSNQPETPQRFTNPRIDCDLVLQWTRSLKKKKRNASLIHATT